MNGARCPDRRWRNIAVVVEPQAEWLGVVHEAAAVAHAHSARLTVICVAPRVWSTVGLAGVCLPDLELDCILEASETARRMAAGLPPDLPCTTYARCGSIAVEVLRILEREQSDVLFLGSSRRILGSTGRSRRAIRRLRRRTRGDMIVLGVAESGSPRRPLPLDLPRTIPGADRFPLGSV